MPRFAANLSMMFTEVPFLERFEAAAKAGFQAVEFQFPYAFDAGEIRRRLAAQRLEPVLHNLPAGDWAAGDRGVACDPARVDEFKDGLKLAIDYARTLGVRQLNCLAGVVPAGVASADAWRCLSDNLAFASRELAQHDIRLMVEACNRHDVPGFLIDTSAAALRAIDDAGGENLWLQYDVYHMQRSEGDLIPTISRLLPRIGHIQVADNPGRHQPGTGEIHYPFLFAMLDRLGYEGWVAGEYIPRGRTEDGLAWCFGSAASSEPGARTGSAARALSCTHTSD
ncbi:hydroxypyruvate isomerase [Caballeronia sp. LZ035]|uniref:hydroxypyruvate isomerase n=1 Tax=Caballeronia sp. LZ035 TaxID=3038568 RepID=UPI002864E262|nr:hydroxypyruvate isomerase [Caballeronia sp. LZ035]MDR5759091.1 hydroxypyruvate isomerase [Caballeronia sp. LZ035]